MFFLFGVRLGRGADAPVRVRNRGVQVARKRTASNAIVRATAEQGHSQARIVRPDAVGVGGRGRGWGSYYIWKYTIYSAASKQF